MTDIAAWTTGTFRALPPEETWRNIRPYMHEAGITRVADLTHLDSSGVAVHTAVRPNAKTLVMSQGKGVTPVLSKVSAVMESLELWFAEQPITPELCATPEREVRSALEYPLLELDVHESSILTVDTPLDWLLAETIVTQRSSLVPVECVNLDRRVGRTWQPPLFVKSSNGLASGNSVPEAALHALCEVVERDAVSEASPRVTARPIDPDALGSVVVTSLVEQIRVRGSTVKIYDIAGRFNVPCFAATVGGDGFAPRLFAGFGCHPDSAVAALRAITEAIQNRVALIAGSRDDLPTWRYDQLRLETLPASPDSTTHPVNVQRFDGDLSYGVASIAEALAKVTGYEPLVVRLTPSECTLQVVRVLAPGVRYHDMSRLR